MEQHRNHYALDGFMNLETRTEITSILQEVLPVELALSLVQEGAVLFPQQARRLVARWAATKAAAALGTTISEKPISSPAERELFRSEARRAGKRVLAHRYEVRDGVFRTGEFITSGPIVEKFLQDPLYWEIKEKVPCPF